MVRLRVAGLVALGALLVLSDPAEAAVTVGPDVSNAPLLGTAGCTTAGSEDTFINSGSIGVSPLSGVVVRFRVRAATNGANGMAPELRIVKSAGGGTYTGAGSADQSPFASGVATNATRLPISAGDFIGVDVPCDASASTRQSIQQGTSTGAGGLGFSELVDSGAPHSPTASFGSNAAALLNADVEPDTDRDVFGDETQDKCVGTPGTSNGCSSTVTLDRLRQKGTNPKVKLTATVPGSGTLKAGSASDPALANASAKKSLKTVTRALTSTTKQQVVLTLNLTKSARLKLADSGKLKAKVTVVYTPPGGPAGTQTGKVKLKS